MPDHHHYKAWLCDLDGTLYKPGGLKLLMGLELVLFGLSELKTIRAFRAEHEKLRRRPRDPRHATPFDEQIARTAAQLTLEEEHVRRTVERWMVERPARWLPTFRRSSLHLEIVAYREQGGRTAIVSDYPATRKLQSLGWHHHFDVVVANGEPDGPDALKPEPAGYLRAAERLGVHPRDCLVIGDRDDADGEAARAAGMAFRKIG
ncbi:MAG TPA: HAD family hydrolase [Polyangiaceae bacterium]|nr:HAD family hydrolase [Polyangiaceae bacterium]